VGADTVVSAVHGFTDPGRSALRRVDCEGNANLVNAARAAGADVVLMSVGGASPDSPMELFRMKYAAEEYLRSSGVPATVVRAGAFTELWAEILATTAARSGRPVVFGRGDNPINVVCVNDVAAMVDRVVADPTSRGTTVYAGGPNLTMTELAAAVQAAAHRSGAPRHVPRGALRVAAPVLGILRPAIGRQLRAAVSMDTVALSFDAAARPYSDLPTTSLETCLTEHRSSVV
jgi:NADH dehydrogenase